ncbi:hypothetical protein, partial [Pontixanthobacter sp.]|uniref:hypothetical protein n=1 Tax=Pontixanthobacter sp. TaxID=2792078 RepID=UPI003C7ED7DB
MPIKISGRIVHYTVLASAMLSLSGCVVYDAYGDDQYYGSGYDPYYQPGFAYSYFGWYDDYYYPGIGTIVYDRFGRRYTWNNRQSAFWRERARRHYRSNNDARWDHYQRGDDGQYRDRRNRGDRYRDGWRRGGEARGDDTAGRADRRDRRRGGGASADTNRGGNPDNARSGGRRDRGAATAQPPVSRGSQVRQRPPAPPQPAQTRARRPSA